MTATTEQTAGAKTFLRTFSGSRGSALGPIDQVASEESQAALRQFSLERLMAYGVHHPDALELRGRVWAGEAWQDVATDLAVTCLDPPEGLTAPESPATRANRLYRASALLRMSQMMMIRDAPERVAIVERAAGLYETASQLSGDRHRWLLETPDGALGGWLYPSRRPATLGRAVVIGGIEGWAMDFADLGVALAVRGVETLLLDGPGQGESRILHRHYLRPGVEKAYGAVFDALDQKGKLPLGFVGNSMGGAVAMHVAARDPRVRACCNNGGHPVPGRPRGNTTFAQKMVAHVGQVPMEDAEAVWRTIDPIAPDKPLKCPLLVVHGGLDPMIPTAEADRLFDWAASPDKTMVTFSDGDHCIYNHADDKHALIGDWMASRLAAV